ncbi:MAG: hypothetical protein JZU63_02155, partial [Rhodoferax sp.]|nr:hypothetical protein [Rhodoferax sp.]
LENVKGPSIKPVSLGKGEGFKMIKKWENIYRRDDSVGMWAIIYPVGNHRNDSESDWRNYLESVIGAGKSSLDEMPGIQFFENYAVIITVRIPGSKRVTEGLDADDDLGDMKDMAYAPVISRRGVMFRFIFAPDENDRPVPYKDMLIPYKVFYELGIMDYYTLRDAWENDEIRMSGEDAVMLYARDKSKFVNRHWDDDLEEIKLLPPEQQLLEAAEDDDDIGDMKEFDQPAYTDAEMDEMLATEVADKLRAAGLKFGDCKKLRNIRMGGLRDIVRLGKDAAFVLGNRMKVQTDGTALVSMWAVIRYSPEYCQYTDWALYINKIIGKENQVWVFNDNLVEITIPVGPSSQKFMAERLAVRIKSATPEGLKRLEGVYKEIFEQAKHMSSTLDKAPIQERYDVVLGSIGRDGVIRSEESTRSHTGAGVQRGKCWRYNPTTKIVYWCGDDSEHDVEDEGRVEQHISDRYGYTVQSHIALEELMDDDFSVAHRVSHGGSSCDESLIQEIAGCVNFWLDPKGNAFNAGSSHAEWAAKHLGIKLPNSAAEKDFWSVQGDIYRRMAKKGWLRVAILP